MSSQSLDVRVRANVLVNNLWSTEVVGSCPLSLPSIAVGPSSHVLNEGIIAAFGVCGFGISVDRDSAVTNSGIILTHNYISFGIVSSDNGVVQNNGLISTAYQGSSGIIGGDNMRITAAAGGRISTTGQGSHGIEAGANALVTNDGVIIASGDASFGISAATKSTVINNGSIETSANNSIGVKIIDGSLANTGHIRSVLSGTAFALAPTMAVSIAGNEAHFTNAASGLVEATHIGVHLDGADNTSMSNGGRIDVSSITRFDGTVAPNGGAIVVTGTAPAQINNSGTIVARDAIPAVRSLGSRVSLTNSGTIIGDVLLSGGNDLVNYRGGSVVDGTIDFGAGADLLILQGGGIFNSSVLNLEILSKSGDGIFVLARDLAAHQQVNIFDRGGIVINPGVRLVSAATGNLGLLRGAGVIDGLVTNGGIIAPGTEATKGTLTITGAFQQFSGGTLAIRLSPDGSSDRLTVGGAAALAGTLALTYDGTAFRDGQRFDVLTPISGSLSTSGQFTLAAPSLAFVKAGMVTTSSGGLAIEINRLSYDTAGATEGQRSVGRLLDRLQTAPPPALQATLEQLEFSSPGTATAILESLTPEAPGAVQNLGSLTLARIEQDLRRRAPSHLSSGHFAWARGFSADGRSRGVASVAHYDLQGVMAGVDTAFGGLRLGIAAARIDGDFVRDRTTSAFDASLIALTAGKRWNEFGIEGALIYGHGSPEMRRAQEQGGALETLSSRAASDLWSASLEGTYEKAFGPVLISPHVGAAYHRAGLSGIDEGDVLGVRTADDALESFRPRLGAGVSTAVGRFRPYGDLSVSVELLQRMPRISARLIGVPNSEFELHGDARRRLAVDAEAGLAVTITAGLEGYIAGTMTANDLLAGRALSAGLILRW